MALRSITNRLTLLFFAITLVAISGLYLGVTSGLSTGVRDQRLNALTLLARQYSVRIRDALDRSLPRSELDRRVRAAADSSGARVTLMGINRGTQGVQTYVASDSTAQREIPDLQFGVAVDAARTGRVARGTEAAAGGSVAEAALPLRLTPPGSKKPGVYYVAVYSAPLQDDATVSLIRRRVLLAGGFALLASLLAGYIVARAFSLRIKRMEGSARRVASGDFGARFESGSTDELGQLARTLDAMQRQLAELETARRRFIATASHELRTPIFSLGGFLELLEDEELDEETRAAFLRQLRVQVDRLGKLATDLLDLSRLEAGSLELRPEATDVGELARSVAAEFTPALAAHESHLDLRLAGEVEVVCDPERVAQIMRILIDNALNHTPSGTDVVVAAARRDGRVRLSVTDFGGGIERGALHRIFEPFFTSDDAQGSGLGLAIAHELAERMAGELSADSVPGRTTFSLELPA
ncbi:MAG: two-component system, OmpR family, sensor kinase [Solirubrobacteraceae bacterium]|jgi:signal transduction histidine kinase|nr:two-component system, OmpR family, sensor kinase [Solirubrobacteraceae bacterium]MEA2278295.1 two-component system, OmpR family, sensor kinase [Solirubrobacteraceae bacterium]MEA2357220.1 two-component system, OmpR family, sensor kinase [Solirubrobacteraceae bacterium]